LKVEISQVLTYIWIIELLDLEYCRLAHIFALGSTVCRDIKKNNCDFRSFVFQILDAIPCSTVAATVPAVYYSTAHSLLLVAWTAQPAHNYLLRGAKCGREKNTSTTVPLGSPSSETARRRQQREERGADNRQRKALPAKTYLTAIDDSIIVTPPPTAKMMLQLIQVHRRHDGDTPRGCASRRRAAPSSAPSSLTLSVKLPPAAPIMQQLQLHHAAVLVVGLVLFAASSSPSFRSCHALDNGVALTPPYVFYNSTSIVTA